MRDNWKRLLRAAGIRAAHTVLQAVAGYLTMIQATGRNFAWGEMLITAGVAGAVSMCKSLAAGLPEVPEVPPDD